MNQKKTVLYESHIERGAQMVEFANAILPVRFSSEQEEHMAVRRKVGIFDVSHMGQIFVTEKNAVNFLDYVLTNDVRSLSIGKAHYSLMLNENAGIVDDVIVYRLDRERFLLCVNAANIEKDFAHLQNLVRTFSEVKIENASSCYAQIALQGPRARDLLKTFSDEYLVSWFSIKKISLIGIDCLVSCTGYTGEDGFEIFVENDKAKILWDCLLERGAMFGILPCGLAARDSLRLEAGMRLYGNDMDEKTTPREAGLMFAVVINRPSDFSGKDALLRDKTPTKKLCGFRLLERGVARHGYNVLNNEHESIGSVTSSGYLPEKNLAIGFAMVKNTTHMKDEVLIDIRGRLVRAEICAPKFL